MLSFCTAASVYFLLGQPTYYGKFLHRKNELLTFGLCTLIHETEEVRAKKLP